jgi:hypothetical protein
VSSTAPAIPGQPRDAVRAGMIESPIRRRLQAGFCIPEIYIKSAIPSRSLTVRIVFV